jgi:predicted metal-dependent enzyme (double-stranded beta helix superfamily)
MTATTWAVERRDKSVYEAALESEALLTVAQGFARTAQTWSDLLANQERSWQLIAATTRFEAWVIAWPIGGSIAYHDHCGAFGAVVVAAGQLAESSLVVMDGGQVTQLTTSLGAGDHLLFGPGHIHDVVNAGVAPALSVHVYSPRLSSMTYYDFSEAAGVVTLRTEEYRDGVLV